MELKELVGKSLENFTIQEFTEVYKTNDDGRKESSLGFFRNETVAKAFAQQQTDAAWHRTDKQLVLTDGKVGFLMGKPITILDDEEATLKIREKAIAKLSEEERRVLGL